MLSPKVYAQQVLEIAVVLGSAKTVVVWRAADHNPACPEPVSHFGMGVFMQHIGIGVLQAKTD